MRVAIFSDLLYPFSSHMGGGLAMKLIIEELAKRGIRITVITTEHMAEYAKGYEELPSVKVKFLKGSIKGYARNNYFLVKWNRKRITGFLNNADLVYISEPGYSLIPLAKKLGKPVVSHAWSYFLVCPKHDYIMGGIPGECQYNNCSLLTRLKCKIIDNVTLSRLGLQTYPYSMLETLYYIGRKGFHYFIWKDMVKHFKSSDTVLAPSDSLRETITIHYPELYGRCFTVSCPLPKVDYIKRQKDKIITFLYLGGKRYGKGYYFLIEALKLIRSKTTRFILLGCKDSLIEKIIDKYNLRDRVILREYISHETLFREIYPYVDVTIVPSVAPEAGVSFAALEANLAGRFVIASMIGGLSDGIKQGINGLLVRPGDVYALSSSIEMLINLGQDSLQEMGLLAREYVINKFLKEKPADSLIRIFRRLV